MERTIAEKGADPRPEDGHVDIANELVEQLCRVNLTARESRVLWYIFRKVNGWHKERDRISYSQFEKGTGLKHAHIARTLKKLQARNMITGTPKGNSIEYNVQNDYTQWKTVPHVGTEKNGTPLGPNRYPMGVVKTVPPGGTHKRKERNTQKKENDYISLKASGDGEDEDGGFEKEITLVNGDIVTAEGLWQRVRTELEGDVTASSYNYWLRKIVGLGVREGVFYIEAPTQIIEDFMRRFRPIMEKVLSDISEPPLKVSGIYGGYGDDEPERLYLLCPDCKRDFASAEELTQHLWHCRK